MAEAERKADMDEKAEKAVEDVVEFLEAGGEADSPTSDAEAPPPG
jgi:hypothetical protein